jgi:hypothetical protein
MKNIIKITSAGARICRANPTTSNVVPFSITGKKIKVKKKTYIMYNGKIIITYFAMS